MWRHLKYTSVTSLEVDLRKWKTAIYLRIGRRFEDWTSIRDWTSIWVLHIYEWNWIVQNVSTILKKVCTMRLHLKGNYLKCFKIGLLEFALFHWVSCSPFPINRQIPKTMLILFQGYSFYKVVFQLSLLVYESVIMHVNR